MADLTDTDAQKLFQEVSQSIRDNNTSKLDELIEVKPDEGNPESTEVPVADEPQDTDRTQDTSTPEDGTQETPPPVDETAEGTPDDKEGEQTPDELAELKAQLEGIKKENHHLKSQAGRMPHLQSRVKELDKKLEELRGQLSSPSSQPSAKIKPELQKKLAKLRETDAELADIWEDTLLSATDSAERGRIEAEISRVESLRNEEYESFYQEQKARLVEEIPNAMDIFKGSHWSEWKSSQSKAMRELAGSDDAEDVIFAIRRYEADMRAKYPELTTGETAATPAATDPAVAEKAKQVESARQQRKTTSVVASSPTAAGQVSSPSDAASLFKKFSEEIRKERLG